LLPEVRAAGDFAAYGLRRDGVDTIVVLDLAAGREAYRIELPRAAEDFDVQADGTLAVAVPRTRTATAIGVAGPGRAGVRDLALAARRTDVRIEGDHVAYVRPAGNEGVELALADLEGFARPITFPLAGVKGLDFDGRRFAVLTPSCVYGGDLSGLAVRAVPPEGPCPRAQATYRIPRRAAFSARRRSVRIRVACPMAAAEGCRGRLLAGYTPRGGRGRQVLAGERFAVPRGAARTVELRLTRRGVRALRGRASDRLHLAMSLAGGEQRLRASVRILAPTRGPRRPPAPAPPPPPGGAGGEFVIGGR